MGYFFFIKSYFYDMFVFECVHIVMRPYMSVACAFYYSCNGLPWFLYLVGCGFSDIP